MGRDPPSHTPPHCLRSVALFHLEEYESALEAFQHGQQLAPGMAALSTWTRKCQTAIEGERAPCNMLAPSVLRLWRNQCA